MLPHISQQRNAINELNLSRLYAGIAQLVEHDLAKVGVASSSLVSRSKLAEWQNGYAADCKSVDLGSTPGSASS